MIEQIKALLLKENMSDAELARRAGIPQPTVHRILTGETRSPRLENLDKIARVFGLTTQDLLAGINIAKQPIATYSANIKELTKNYGVPLIPWNDHGVTPNPDTDKMILCPIEHGPNTYATFVPNNTMQGGSQLGYAEGSIIFVDPGLALKVKNGDRIIAKIKDGNIATFKQLQIDSGMKYLLSLNLQYPPITKEFEVTGVVIGTWNPEI